MGENDHGTVTGFGRLKYPNGAPWTCAIGHPLYSDGTHAGGISCDAGNTDLSPRLVSRETIEARIARYRDAMADRRQLVKDMKAANYSITQIAANLGMGRPTVGRILGATWPYHHGKRQHSDVSRETSPDVSRETSPDRAQTVTCPECGALPGHRCHDPFGNLAPGVLGHAARVKAWRKVSRETNPRDGWTE
jgi:hypothetical protein